MPDPATRLEESRQAASKRFGASPPGAVVQPCAPRTWIEVQLLGEDNLPLPGERYRIVLTDGSIREGTLDAEGVAGFDDIDPGTCEFTLPDLDRDAWEPLNR